MISINYLKSMDAAALELSRANYSTDEQEAILNKYGLSLDRLGNAERDFLIQAIERYAGC